MRFLILFLLAIPALATIDHDAEYKACMELVKLDKQAALESSAIWAEVGGSIGAQHCAAAAYVQSGQWDAAIKNYNALSKNNQVPAKVRSDIIREGGILAFQRGKPEHAITLLGSALKLTPDEAALWLQRGMAHAGMRKHQAAISDFTKTLSLSPNNPAALTLRASAYRFADKLDLALLDVNKVIQDNPSRPDALLERGVIYAMQNKPGLAAKDWQTVASQHKNTPLGKAAAQNLKALQDN